MAASLRYNYKLPIKIRHRHYFYCPGAKTGIFSLLSKSLIRLDTSQSYLSNRLPKANKFWSVDEKNSGHITLQENELVKGIADLPLI